MNLCIMIREFLVIMSIYEQHLPLRAINQKKKKVCIFIFKYYYNFSNKMHELLPIYN